MNATTTRSGELNEKAISYQVVALADYLRRPGNRGLRFWLDSKDFHPADRQAIVRGLPR